MTHKHAEPRPSPSWSPPFSHSHLQHLLANLHLLIYGRVLEELHAEVALPQGRVALHAVTRAAHKQHLHTVLASVGGEREGGQPNRKYHQAELDVSRGDPPRKAWELVVWLLKYNFPHSKALFLIMSVSYHQAQWVIMGHMNISSECSKMAGIMIGMSIRLPPTLRQEEISLTPHQWCVCLHWKNICFIVISTDLSHATLHNMIKSSSVIHSGVYH